MHWKKVLQEWKKLVSLNNVFIYINLCIFLVQGERERHEEQKRILAEKTKLYRERTSMETTGDNNFNGTRETRRRHVHLFFPLISLSNINNF